MVVYHRIVALSKLSRHQADQEERARARAEQRYESYVGPVRPIAIGDALLRLAAAFMPFQVGVGVRGGLMRVSFCTKSVRLPVLGPFRPGWNNDAVN